MIKVIIAGTRGFNNYPLLKETCDHMLQNHDEIEVVSGNAMGADRLGEIWADENGHSVKEFKPDWAKHGNSAGYIRNKSMAIYADALIVFWDGESAGSRHMIDLARDAGLKIKICEF